ncbi:MAG: hypothetical protein QOG77_3589 [Solirubrobacteraceae bacterium]|jgi:hypothetical protein|nr:hypothetical protein [Solirubrobacteraceae bacterium]
MGLLDEAIREHLELKRRHGADPTEVARQESEALGPARRATQTAPAPDEAEPDFTQDPDDAEDFAEQPELRDPAPEPVVRRREPEPEPEPEPELLEPEPEPELLEPEPRAHRIDPDLIDQPTVEHPAARPEPPEDDLEAEMEVRRRESETDEDVLEGTPEFLEETPEHDRLWFEQRPPRDFDFDD